MSATLLRGVRQVLHPAGQQEVRQPAQRRRVRPPHRRQAAQLSYRCGEHRLLVVREQLSDAAMPPVAGECVAARVLDLVGGRWV